MIDFNTHSNEGAPGLFHKPCGKNRYPDKKAAISQINYLANKRGRHGRPERLRAYQCPDCDGWHLTKRI